MKKIEPVVIGVIFNTKTNKFLLTHRNEATYEKNSPNSPFNNCWNFPGGGIEFGENPEHTVIRELREELGIDVDVNCLIPKAFSSVRKNWHGILICYICKIKDLNNTIKLNEESDTYGWFTLEEINKLHILPLAYEIAKETTKLL